MFKLTQLGRVELVLRPKSNSASVHSVAVLHGPWPRQEHDPDSWSSSFYTGEICQISSITASVLSWRLTTVPEMEQGKEE